MTWTWRLWRVSFQAVVRRASIVLSRDDFLPSWDVDRRVQKLPNIHRISGYINTGSNKNMLQNH